MSMKTLFEKASTPNVLPGMIEGIECFHFLRTRGA
jgi:hypothetical protein